MLECENLPSSVYITAWHELYKLFGERLDNDNVELMDGVLEGVIADTQAEEIEA